MSNIDDASTWHYILIEQLSELFKSDPDARAFVLTGSLASQEIEVDFWSDVDAKVVLADQSVDRYFQSLDWLQPFGQLVGVEKHDAPVTKTVRVCLEGFRRFDLVFIPESTLQGSPLQTTALFQFPCKIIWSRIPNLENSFSSQESSLTYQDISNDELERISNDFWFMATVAITKVARNDLLIGTHLTLDLIRNCLVLKMIQRDQIKRTRIHRTGGWGNELIDAFNWENKVLPPLRILALITQSCTVFDDLASKLMNDYTPRTSLLKPAIDAANDVIRKGNE